MCDQRERLIGYIYDECEPADRAAMQQHLETCAECRDEIAALRSVRQELQSWEVPDHESVWKPFIPAPAPAWWSQVPRWALAAAAGLVIASGATGGAVSYALLRQQPVQAAPGVVETGSRINASDMTALERRLEGMIRQEVDRLNARVQLVGSRQLTPELEASLHRAFDQQLAELRRNSEKQLDIFSSFNANLEQWKRGVKIDNAIVKTRVENLALAVEQSGGKQ